jgi:hypothetical protein
MGNLCSNETAIVERQERQERLRAEAQRLFNQRIDEYSYAHHGSHFEYIQWCCAQYQLDCIPEFCRQGSNYTPHEDAFGNQR